MKLKAPTQFVLFSSDELITALQTNLPDPDLQVLTHQGKFSLSLTSHHFAQVWERALHCESTHHNPISQTVPVNNDGTTAYSVKLR